MRFNDESTVKNDDIIEFQDETMEIQEVKKDTRAEIEERIAAINENLRNSPEVIQIAKKLDVKDMNAVMEFGNEPAVQISKFADRILDSIKLSSVENSGVMLKELTKVMQRFDKEELEEKPEGFFGKLFSSGKKTIDQLLSKYQTLGGEIDRIYSRIVSYKSEITKTNKMLEEMFSQNFDYYMQLEKYATACNIVVEELESEDLPYWEEKAKNGGGEESIRLQEVKYAIEMLRQRAYDLEMAKMVAMQTAPQIRVIQKGNYKLIGKIHSAFIVTIPVFKNGLIQAVTLKRQKLVAESMEALDKATNELLLKNANNIKEQSIKIAKISGGPSVKIETLQDTWRLIMEGIDETEKIEEENKRLREEGMKKIHEMKIEFMEKAR